MTGYRFTIHRFMAVLRKEMVQMRRDRMTLGLLIGIPVMQLFIFGYAINMVPRHLATVVNVADPGPLANSMIAAINNSSYFDIIKATNSPAVTRTMLAQGKASFAITIPPNFSRDIVRGARPDLVIEADATDPAAGSYALAAMNGLATTALRDDLVGPLAALAPKSAPFNVVVHNLYNPENITQYNIVPGLLGVILTLTMVLATAIALTRERERGTYENLLAMPTRPVEIMVGKITPNIFVGAFQATLILVLARYVFDVPFIGSLALLGITSTVFITALLGVGYTISTVARNQMQAMQMTFFFLLPSIMLSGFIFPFRGMPGWAQAIGEVLPITHFLRIVRGILLKGNGALEVWPEVWPMILFLFAAGTVAVLRFRRTLD
jgi:ABC-2 type transport system permease protein